MENISNFTSGLDNVHIGECLAVPQYTSFGLNGSSLNEENTFVISMPPSSSDTAPYFVTKSNNEIQEKNICFKKLVACQSFNQPDNYYNFQMAEPVSVSPTKLQLIGTTESEEHTLSNRMNQNNVLDIGKSANLQNQPIFIDNLVSNNSTNFNDELNTTKFYDINNMPYSTFASVNPSCLNQLNKPNYRVENVQSIVPKVHQSYLNTEIPNNNNTAFYDMMPRDMNSTQLMLPNYRTTSQEEIYKTVDATRTYNIEQRNCNIIEPELPAEIIQTEQLDRKLMEMILKFSHTDNIMEQVQNMQSELVGEILKNSYNILDARKFATIIIQKYNTEKLIQMIVNNQKTLELNRKEIKSNQILNKNEGYAIKNREKQRVQSIHEAQIKSHNSIHTPLPTRKTFHPNSNISDENSNVYIPIRNITTENQIKPKHTTKVLRDIRLNEKVTHSPFIRKSFDITRDVIVMRPFRTVPTITESPITYNCCLQSNFFRRKPTILLKSKNKYEDRTHNLTKVKNSEGDTNQEILNDIIVLDKKYIEIPIIKDCLRLANKCRRKQALFNLPGSENPIFEMQEYENIIFEEVCEDEEEEIDIYPEPDLAEMDDLFRRKRKTHTILSSSKNSNNDNNYINKNNDSINNNSNSGINSKSNGNEIPNNNNYNKIGTNRNTTNNKGFDNNNIKFDHIIKVSDVLPALTKPQETTGITITSEEISAPLIISIRKTRPPNTSLYGLYGSDIDSMDCDDIEQSQVNRKSKKCDNCKKIFKFYRSLLIHRKKCSYINSELQENNNNSEKIFSYKSKTNRLMC